MDAISEVFPMLAGVLTGVVCLSISRRHLRIAVWTVMTIVFGALATYLSGEHVESWAFILLDMLWVGGIAILVVFGRQYYLRRRSQN
jgi:hypothetical protein